MTTSAKKAGTATEPSRFLGETRIVVDLFGPVIDIDRIDLFRGTNARFATEEAIAKHHRLPPHPKHREWTGQDVLDVVKVCLRDPKVALTLIDEDIFSDLCRAASFSSVWIVSSVSDEEIFRAAKVVLKKYMASFIEGARINDSQIVRYEKVDNHYGVERFLRNNKSDDFTIVVDDSPAFHLTDDDDLVPGEHYDVWLHGQKGSERLHRDIATLIDARRRIEIARSFVRDLDEPVKLADYCAVPGYLVCDKLKRDYLRNQVTSIKALLSRENQGPPICVFLSGPPGSGKSYFVQKCADELSVIGEYPISSLSGVREGSFDQAILEHISQVFDHEASGNSVAFLDEVDTSPGRSPVAFRMLMNAMTGKRMTDLGLSMRGSKSGSASRLVWFFAGSAGRTREEIESRFAPADLKTHDFFDRIHFNLEMPGVDDVGQAVVQALACVHHYDGKRSNSTHQIREISKDVLLLMGAMQWSSVRQLDTICRLAVGRLNDDATLSVKHFEDIGTVHHFQELQKQLQSSPQFGDASIAVEWKATC